VNEIVQYCGHRQRLKDRFSKSQDGDLPDYEILELLLCYANPRKDMKPLAKKLISTYGSISSIISLDFNTLINIEGIGSSMALLLKLVREVTIRSTQAELNNKPVISSWNALIEYLRSSMGHSKVEMFRVLYLNKMNMIIEDNLVRRGTIDHVNIYPREVLKQALFIDASAVILVHNHPSGKAKPSTNDIEMTQLISSALKPINVVVHDHVIITQKEYFSFKSHGMIN